MGLHKFHAEDAVKQVKHVCLKLEVGPSRYQPYHLVVLYIQGHYSHKVVDLVHPLDLDFILQDLNPLLLSHHVPHPNTP
jgi:hypothetical protein